LTTIITNPDIILTGAEKTPDRRSHVKTNETNETNEINEMNQMNEIDETNEMDDLIRRWYVIYTKPHSENQAQEQLERKQIPVFLPKIRQVKFRKHKLQERIQPLFPSYIFARFTIPEDYYDVKWARGVKRIVGSGDMPIPLDDSIVIFLREQVNEKGLIQPTPNLRNGDKIRVKQGPLEGLWGIIHDEVDPKGRVKVLMDILHSGAKVELPYSYVERC